MILPTWPSGGRAPSIRVPSRSSMRYSGTIADVGSPVLSGATSADIRSGRAKGRPVQPGGPLRRRGSGGRRVPEDPPRPVRRVHPLEAGRRVDLGPRADRVRAHTGGAAPHAGCAGAPSIRGADLLREQLPGARLASSSVRARSSSWSSRTTRPTIARPPPPSICRCRGSGRSRTVGGSSTLPSRGSARSSTRRAACTTRPSCSSRR